MDKPDTNSQSTNVRTDEIIFHDYISPAIPIGDYEIKVEQQIEDEGLSQSFVNTQQFSVYGNRFRLNFQDIHTIYPPIDGQGAFEHVLPQVILNNNTLPWERSADKQTPTLALLLFTPDELYIEDWTKVSNTGTSSKTISEFKNPENGYLQPELEELSHENDDEYCRCIEMESQYFNQIIPRLNELKYLAHIREVNSNNKSNDQENTCFSTIFSNRLPQKNDRNIVHLVSLEGFTKYLQPDSSGIENGKKVRLVSLASWAFYCEAPNEEFEVVLEKLVENHSPLRYYSDTQISNEVIANAFEGGYFPVKYSTRQGEQTTAFYRGPLVPNMVANQQFSPHFSAESAMIYDENIGLFDVSYAVAWQTGRLLALSDTHFSKSLLEWKKQTNQLLNVLFAKQNFYKKLVAIYNQIQDDDNQIDDLEDLMSDDISNKLLALVFKQSLVELGFTSRGDIAGERIKEDLVNKAKEELLDLPGIVTLEQFETIKNDTNLNQSLIQLLFNP